MAQNDRSPRAPKSESIKSSVELRQRAREEKWAAERHRRDRVRPLYLEPGPQAELDLRVAHNMHRLSLTARERLIEDGLLSEETSRRTYQIGAVSLGLDWLTRNNKDLTDREYRHLEQLAARAEYYLEMDRDLFKSLPSQDDDTREKSEPVQD